jgi:hypothetical protein
MVVVQQHRQSVDFTVEDTFSLQLIDLRCSFSRVRKFFRWRRRQRMVCDMHSFNDGIAG